MQYFGIFNLIYIMLIVINCANCAPQLSKQNEVFPELTTGIVDNVDNVKLLVMAQSNGADSNPSTSLVNLNISLNEFTKFIANMFTEVKATIIGTAQSLGLFSVSKNNATRWNCYDILWTKKEENEKEREGRKSDKKKIYV